MDINSADYRNLATIEDKLDAAIELLAEVYTASKEYEYLVNIKDGAREMGGLMQILVAELHASVDDAESEAGL